MNAITGSMKATILLQQVVYLTPRWEESDGWIQKSQPSWMQATGLSRKEFLNGVAGLEANALIETKYDRLNHDFYMRLNISVYNDAIRCISAKSHQMPKGEMEQNQLYITQETENIRQPIDSKPNAQRGFGEMPKGDFAKIKSLETREEIQEITNVISPEPQNAVSGGEGSLTGQWLIEQWNIMATTLSLPVKTPRGAKNKSVRQKIILRLRENPDMDFWLAVFAQFPVCPHLRGDNGWKPTLDWLVDNDHNCVKVYEGAYASNGITRHYTQMDHSPAAQERLRQRLEAIDRGEG